MKEASIVASAAGAPARQHLIPGEARQARRRRRGSPPSRTASTHRDALRVSDVARRSHEHPACVPMLWALRGHVKTLDDAWRDFDTVKRRIVKITGRLAQVFGSPICKLRPRRGIY